MKPMHRALSAGLFVIILGGLAAILLLALPADDETIAEVAQQPTSSIFMTATAVAMQYYEATPVFALTTTPLATLPAAGGGGGGDFYANAEYQPVENRIIIKDAYLNIVVEDAAAAAQTISRMAEDMGGWVISSDIFVQSKAGNSGVTSGTVRVCVPSDRLDEALERIRGMAVEVRSESISGEDVTNAYTDLQSQLRNLEAAEAQLVEIMASADSTEGVVAVFNQLTYTRGEIERIKGQLQFYSESAAFSLIAVDLAPLLPTPTPTPTLTPTPEDKWRPADTLEEASESAVDTVQGGIDVVIWGMIYAALALAVFGLPSLVIYWLWRRRT